MPNRASRENGGRGPRSATWRQHGLRSPDFLPCRSVDRQVAKIAATFSLGVSPRTRNFLGRVEHLLRELVRQMVFADQNLYIEAEFSRLSQNFNNTAGGRNASLRESDDLNVYNRTVQFRQAHRPCRGIPFCFVLGEELRRQLVAGGNDNLVMNARFVWNNEIAPIAVMKDPDDSRVSPADDSHHAAFGANGRAGGLASARTAPLDVSGDTIAVHRASQLIGRNK